MEQRSVDTNINGFYFKAESDLRSLDMMALPSRYTALFFYAIPHGWRRDILSVSRELDYKRQLLSFLSELRS